MTPGHPGRLPSLGELRSGKEKPWGLWTGAGRAGRAEDKAPLAEGRGSILLPFSWLERLNFSYPKKNLLCRHAEHSRNSKSAGDENGLPNTEEYVCDSGLQGI